MQYFQKGLTLKDADKKFRCAPGQVLIQTFWQKGGKGVKVDKALLFIELS
jgi:hypothetical protein